MPDEMAKPTYRKIDRGSNLVMTNPITGDLYVTGSDKLLKRYDYPTEKITQIDWKRAPPIAVEEHQSHSIGTACWDFSQQFKFMATGGKDGNIFMRHVNNISQIPNPIKAHALYSGGVTALCFSQ